MPRYYRIVNGNYEARPQHEIDAEERAALPPKRSRLRAFLRALGLVK